MVVLISTYDLVHAYRSIYWKLKSFNVIYGDKLLGALQFSHVLFVVLSS